MVKILSLILNRLLMEHVLLVSVLHYSVGLEVSVCVCGRKLIFLIIIINNELYLFLWV